MFVLASATGVLALRFVHASLSAWIPAWGREASFVAVMAGGMLIGHVWTFRMVDGRGWHFVGLGREAWRREALLLGVTLGALSILVPAGVLLAMGWLRAEPSNPGSSLGAALASLAVLVPASLWEELTVRGYAFATLRERWGATRTILVTSLAFGALHFLNAGASIGAVSIVTLAGVFLGLVLARTGSL